MKLYIVKGKYNGNKSLNKDSSKELKSFLKTNGHSGVGKSETLIYKYKKF